MLVSAVTPGCAATPDMPLEWPEYHAVLVDDVMIRWRFAPFQRARWNRVYTAGSIPGAGAGTKILDGVMKSICGPQDPRYLPALHASDASAYAVQHMVQHVVQNPASSMRRAPLRAQPTVQSARQQVLELWPTRPITPIPDSPHF